MAYSSQMHRMEPVRSQAAGLPFGGRPAASAVDRVPLRTAHVDRVAELSPLDVESLLLNLDAAQAVHAHAHLFSWTQGLLQTLVRHELLFFARPRAETADWQVECVSTRIDEQARLVAALHRELTALPRLVDAWKEHQLLPLAVPVRAAAGAAAGAFCIGLECIGVGELAVHGCADASGEPAGFFVLACAAGTAGPRELGLLRLVVPFLHEAWLRTLRGSVLPGRHDAAGPHRDPPALVTAREREILQWIYLGKSNHEIGMILGISPLTVKNHVQKLLQKLDVVNRAQAVGKALEAHLIGT